jgi:hypothetical protein
MDKEGALDMVRRHTLHLRSSDGAGDEFMLKLLSILGLLLIVGVWPATAAQPNNLPPRQENPARGRSYKLAPKPDYWMCTDAGDATDLTDGKIETQTGSSLWTQKGCVGWAGGVPVDITVDLGRVEPIQGAAFHSAAGTSGCHYPFSIEVQVSEDGKTYYQAGDLAALSPAPPYGKYSLHHFSTDQLRTRGRFVRFVIVPHGSFVFCDEVEVFRGSDSLLKEPIGGKKVSGPPNVLPMIRLGVRRRLLKDAAQVKSAIEKQASTQTKAQLLQD